MLSHIPLHFGERRSTGRTTRGLLVALAESAHEGEEALFFVQHSHLISYIRGLAERIPGLTFPARGTIVRPHDGAQVHVSELTERALLGHRGPIFFDHAFPMGSISPFLAHRIELMRDRRNAAGLI